MTQELIGELYQRYMHGELTLDDAAEQIFGLMHGREDEVATTADHERAFALFGRLKWHALREALPGSDIPRMGAQDFLADLGELEKGNDTD